jgi:hypothetical protein
LPSPFCAFDTEGYDPWLYPDIYEYQSVVWTNQKISISSVIAVFVASTFSEIIMHLKGEIVEFSVMMTQNTCVGHHGRVKEGLELETMQMYTTMLSYYCVRYYYTL